jgi:hypothetical protein
MAQGMQIETGSGGTIVPRHRHSLKMEWRYAFFPVLQNKYFLWLYLEDVQMWQDPFLSEKYKRNGITLLNS